MYANLFRVPLLVVSLSLALIGNAYAGWASTTSGGGGTSGWTWPNSVWNGQPINGAVLVIDCEDLFGEQCADLEKMAEDGSTGVYDANDGEPVKIIQAGSLFFTAVGDDGGDLGEGIGAVDVTFGDTLEDTLVRRCAIDTTVLQASSGQKETTCSSATGPNPFNENTGWNQPWDANPDNLQICGACEIVQTYNPPDVQAGASGRVTFAPDVAANLAECKKGGKKTACSFFHGIRPGICDVAEGGCPVTTYLAYEILYVNDNGDLESQLVSSDAILCSSEQIIQNRDKIIAGGDTEPFCGLVALKGRNKGEFKEFIGLQDFAGENLVNIDSDPNSFNISVNCPTCKTTIEIPEDEAGFSVSSICSDTVLLEGVPPLAGSVQVTANKWFAKWNRDAVFEALLNRLDDLLPGDDVTVLLSGEHAVSGSCSGPNPNTAPFLGADIWNLK